MTGKIRRATEKQIEEFSKTLPLYRQNEYYTWLNLSFSVIRALYLIEHHPNVVRRDVLDRLEDLNAVAASYGVVYEVGGKRNLFTDRGLKDEYIESLLNNTADFPLQQNPVIIAQVLLGAGRGESQNPHDLPDRRGAQTQVSLPDRQASTGIHLHLGVKRISGGTWFNPNNFDYQEHYINGKWNEQFTRDLQTYFGTTVDGIISGQIGQRKNIAKVQYGLKGSQMVKALQSRLGHIQSGQLDKSTIVALQRALNLIPDGLISETSLTVRKMQNLLSEGKLI